MGVAYGHPTRKEAKASIKKLLHKVRTTKEMQQRIIEIEIALALLHLSPILPKQMPSNAEPRCTHAWRVDMHAFFQSVHVRHSTLCLCSAAYGWDSKISEEKDTKEEGA